MATETHYFSGVCKWPKLFTKDEEFDTYQINLYMDDDSKARYEASGLQLKERADEDGPYTLFRRHHSGNYMGDPDHVFGPPIVMDKEGATIEGNVGNGSTVTVKVEIYDSRMGKGHRLEAVRVNELVEYTGGPKIVMAEDEVPF